MYKYENVMAAVTHIIMHATCTIVSCNYNSPPVTNGRFLCLVIGLMFTLRTMAHTMFT